VGKEGAINRGRRNDSAKKENMSKHICILWRCRRGGKMPRGRPSKKKSIMQSLVRENNGDTAMKRITGKLKDAW